jgi:hypothetical protein
LALVRHLWRLRYQIPMAQHRQVAALRVADRARPDYRELVVARHGGVFLAVVTRVFLRALWYRLLAASGPINQRFADDLTDSLVVLAHRGQ